MQSGLFTTKGDMPVSVHDLMSLWGGFSRPACYTDGGLEKRLELDFATDAELSEGTFDAVTKALVAAGETLTACAVSDGQYAAHFSDSLAVLSPRRLVVSCASAVMLHLALRPLLEALPPVEWAAFQRRDAVSPWEDTTDTSDIMAEEYADLKAAFPSGRPVLCGAVDGEHFFHFIYDNVRRSGGRREADGYLSLFLEGVEPGAGPKAAQTLTTLPGGCYEMRRAFPSLAGVSFESDAAAAAQGSARAAELVAEYRPSTFTAMVLIDKDVDAAAVRAAFSSFDGYKLHNRSLNRFGEGYAFLQVVFERHAGSGSGAASETEA